MIRRLTQVHPGINIVPIDYDLSATKVNQENRIRLMLANARLSEEELEDDAECAYAGAKKEKYA